MERRIRVFAWKNETSCITKTQRKEHRADKAAGRINNFFKVKAGREKMQESSALLGKRLKNHGTDGIMSTEWTLSLILMACLRQWPIIPFTLCVHGIISKKWILSLIFMPCHTAFAENVNKMLIRFVLIV